MPKPSHCTSARCLQNQPLPVLLPRTSKARLRKNRVFRVIFLMRAAAMTDGVMGRDHPRRLELPCDWRRGSRRTIRCGRSGSLLMRRCRSCRGRSIDSMRAKDGRRSRRSGCCEHCCCRRCTRCAIAAQFFASVLNLPPRRCARRCPHWQLICLNTHLYRTRLTGRYCASRSARCTPILLAASLQLASATW